MDPSRVASLRARISEYVESWRAGRAGLGAYQACAEVDDFLVALDEPALADVARQAARKLAALRYPEQPLTGSLTLALPVEQVAALAALAPLLGPPRASQGPSAARPAAEDADPVQALSRHLRLLVEYARWQMTEGVFYHPTLPSAVGGAIAYLKSVGLDRAVFRAPAPRHTVGP